MDKTINNRYQLLNIIKKGGFGTIYQGQDSVLGKKIAVKEINKELLQDSWYISQFQNEARHIAKMNHPNIVRIFDLVETSDNQFHIIMEFIDGFDLSSILKKAQLEDIPIPVHLAVHIVAEICKALDYAHNCCHFESNEPLNLVHQDISPANIMIDRNGSIKLIDFGIAGAPPEELEEKNTVTLQGKIQYMSPEHVNIKQPIDKRSDIFSLGLVLYELIEGRRFFVHDDTHKIIEVLRNGKLKIKDISETPAPLKTVLEKALEKDIEKRYQNANQFYIDLVTYLVLSAENVNCELELKRFMSDFKSDIATSNGTEKTSTKTKSDEPSDVALNDSNKGALPASDQSSSEQEIPQFDISETVIDNPRNEELSLEIVPAIQEQNFEYNEVGDDEIKTIIDIVRLSTRGHKKLVLRSSAIFLALLTLFFVMDISFQWTNVGAGVYDFFFPPAIKITSVPTGASVFLNDEKVNGKTPVSIADISPGVYELKLVSENYKPIVKSIYVPSKGQAEIKGEEVRSSNKPYQFRFKTTIEIESMPSGADVYINNIKYGQKTPCELTWEVGEDCEIDLRYDGFDDLEGFKLDTENHFEEIEDRRLWQFQLLEEPNYRYSVHGLFGKFVTVNSKPDDATIYLNDQPNSVGKTGSNATIFLTATKHKIKIKKRGYATKTINIAIGKDTPQTVYANLSRPVQFKAYDKIAGKSVDIEARVTKIIRNKKVVSSGKRTPFKINLMPFTYYATFTKAGYKQQRVKISPAQNLVEVNMEPDIGTFALVILDQNSGLPLSNVEVTLKSLDQPGTSEILIDVTDVDGTLNGTLKPGVYLLRTSKNGYGYQEKTVFINVEDINLIELNLASK